MRWIKTHEPKIRENYLEIHYSNMNKETQDLITYLEAKNVLMGRNETESRLIKPDEIYYCEIVDRKCYAYLKEEVWKLEEGLAELAERYEMHGFVRISKSMVVGTFILSMHKYLQNVSILLVMFLQYVVLIGSVMGGLWIVGYFMDVDVSGYGDMFRSVTIPYVVLAGVYYISFFREVKKANALLAEINQEE